MKWVTRERPKIDRIACPWLIERFIEKQPEFLYVPADKVLATAQETGAVPYDIPGVKFSHVGEKCSFDAFIAEYKLDAPGLGTLANIVRLNAYVTAREHMQGYMRSRDRQFPGTPPASTLMIVSGFTRAEFLVEIEAIAAAPEQA